MTAHRENHTATLLPNGKVLVAGGLHGSTSFVPTAELYDSAGGTFVAASGPMTGMRNRATRLQNGKVLIADRFRPAKNSNSAELYDPDAGTFTPGLDT
jgi:hypothetical protein